MNRVLAILALTGFVLSLVAHLAASAGINVLALIPLVWLLHLGIFVVFLPFVAQTRNRLGTKTSLTGLRAVMPDWALLLGAALFFYALINFLLFVFTAEGSASIRDGRFVLQDHGRLIRELTANEYAVCQAKVIRGFSGHWLVFYYLPFAWFTFGRKTRPTEQPVP